MPVSKPMPVIDHLSAPFWAGCREHELRFQHCLACGKRRFPAGPICLHCRSCEVEWIAGEGRARVYSWIVVRHPVPGDIYAKDVPYVVALVEFEDGLRMPTNIVGCAPEAITAGMDVEISFADINDKISLPLFRPAAASSVRAHASEAVESLAGADAPE